MSEPLSAHPPPAPTAPVAVAVGASQRQTVAEARAGSPGPWGRTPSIRAQRRLLLLAVAVGASQRQTVAVGPSQPTGPLGPTSPRPSRVISGDRVISRPPRVISSGRVISSRAQVISSGRDISSRLKSLGSRVILSPLRMTRSAQDDSVRYETSHVLRHCKVLYRAKVLCRLARPCCCT